jgi:hypothetical protein
VESELKPAENQENEPGLQPGALADRSGSARFQNSRQRLTMLLLIFVVGIGLPLITLPTFRQRLSSRVEALREAYGGRMGAAVLAKVGENREPVPEEYALAEPPLPQYSQLPAVSQKPAESPSISAGPSVRILRIPAPAPEPVAPATPDRIESVPAEEPAAAEADQPLYRQGVVEREAYELLLKSNATMDRLVQDGDPSLKYESWDALKRTETIYWVRVGFSSVADQSRLEYIWQVDLQTKQIAPLSFNARALAKS